jgi:TRAP-type C4-dicarboxylate transport system permease large subunit
MEELSMILLTIPVFFPLVVSLGFDPVWFGIFVVLVVEMAQITPPVGFNLFVLQGMTGKELPYIARVSMPMFFLMVAAVLLIYFVPGIVTWLPTQMM